MDIEDLNFRVLVSINQSVERGKLDPRVCDLSGQTNISERHVYRILKTLRVKGLIDRERKFRRCIYEITPDGQAEVRSLIEYFRLS